MKYKDHEEWQAAVKKAYPKEAPHIKFKGRIEKGHDTISAEIPGQDRSFGVWDNDKDEGEVLTAKVTQMKTTSFLNRARSVEAELTDKQKQLDVNQDGKISSDDLKKLREGAKPGEASTASFLSRAASTSIRITAGNINTFLQSLGLDPESFEKPRLAKNKKTWVLRLEEGSGTTGSLEKARGAITKKLKKPFLIDAEDGYQYLWILKGKGVVTLDEEEELLQVTSVTGNDVPKMITDIVDAYDDDTRCKSCDINPKTKTIDYQVYEDSGRKAAQKIFKQLFKHFGLSDWKLNLQRGHWGSKD